MMRLGPSKRAPETACPFCGYTFSGFTALADGDVSDAELKQAVPKEGAISVCVACASVLVFNADGSSRKPNAAELARAMAMPVVQLAVATATATIRGRKQ